MRARSICILLLVLATGTAVAQPFPSRPIRIVVPFTPGGGPDVVARAIAPHLQERLRQPVIVENKPGAGGNIGAEFVVKSPPDGHTILITTAGLAAVQWVTKSLPFDVLKDLSQVGAITTLPMVVVVGNGVPVHSVAELIAHAKANPGKLSYASSGVGTLQHLVAEMFMNTTGTRMVHIPYKGAQGMITDMLAGQVHVMFAALNSSLPQINAGKMRAIALADKTRNPILNVPVVNETVPGFDAAFWFGTAVPAGTPEAIVNRLAEEQRAIVAIPEVRSRLVAAGFDITPGTPAETRDRVAAESERWRAVVKAAGIVPE